MKNLKEKLAAVVMAAAAVVTSYCYAPAAPAVSADSNVTFSAVSLTSPVISSYSATDNAIKINWSKVSGASGYYVFRRNNASSSWRWIGTSAAANNYYVDFNISAGTPYQYLIRAYNSSENGPFSNVISTTAKPKNAVITGITASTNAVKVTWNTQTCAGYQVYMKKVNDASWTRICTTENPNQSYFVKTGLSSGTGYYFAVRAYSRSATRAIQFGGFSNCRGITTSVPATTPYQQHGKLSVSGTHIVDKNGKIFQIKGMSTHGIMWEDYRNILSYNSQKVLRDDWKCNTTRIAMYTEEWGGYTTGSTYAAQAKARVKAGVDNATALGMYVVIDWHILNDQDPRKHQSEAIAFFSEMASLYRNRDNVIYEICNEPNGSVNWTTGIKSYCQAVVAAIRRYDSDAIIICGTGTWSQDIDKVLGNRINDKNCVYALHFYANTHTDYLRNRLQSCYNSGLPVLVSEFGTCDSSGNGGFNTYQSTVWLNLLDKLGLGYINWSAASKSETASAFLPGTDLRNIKAGESQLTASGKFVRNWYRTH